MCEPDSIDWEDFGLVGALAQDLADEERERLRLLKEFEPNE